MIIKTIKIDPWYPNLKDIGYAVDFLRNDGLIVYPTDTVYGLGSNINSYNLVKKIDLIKGREKNKPYSLAFSDMNMVKEYTLINKEQEIFIRKHIKEPYTFIVEKKKNVPDFVTKDRYGVGVRIPNHNVCRLLIKYYGSPIISTSANVSGKYPPVTLRDIDIEVAEQVDLIIDSGPCFFGKSSSVVDLTKKEIKIIRT